MLTFTPTPKAALSRQITVDCRSLAGGFSTESVMSWVMSFPSPTSMHVVLPSSAPDVRRLQCTLQGLGCAVSRVRKALPVRLS